MTALKARRERDTGLWTADQFLEFYMTRPEGERWQLVDGLAMMMVPANRKHQRIARNLFRILDDALEENRKDLIAFWDTGVRIPGIDDFNPQPDLLVVRSDATFDRYADSFFFVAEVLSPSNTTEMIDRKIELYQSHPDNLYCLVLEQGFVQATLYAREDGWSRTELRSLADVLQLPAFGVRASLRDIYEGVLLPKA
jgi:Uma2 family endonuclease